MGILLFLPIFVLMYFLMIRPQQRRLREQQALVAKLAPGDEVMLTSGIYGIVTELDGDTIFLEVAEGIELKVAKGAVSKIIPEATMTSSEGTSTEHEPAEPDLPAPETPEPKSSDGGSGGKSKR